MSEGEHQNDLKHSDQVNLETRADILQDTFRHYFTMAMDHHTKAGTTSNILLIIVGAIISLVGWDQEIDGRVDFIGGLAVSIIGLFGAAWVWKQHERYYFWQYIAIKYQQELRKILPGFKTGHRYYTRARKAAKKRYTSLFARGIHERWLWLFLHLIVVLLGAWLMVDACL